MSNVNHQLKVIMVHVAKSAGTSMAIAMGMDHGHDTVAEAKARHAKYWDQYFKFAFVREPFDRMISTYEFARMERSWYHDNVAPGPADSHGDRHPDHDAVRGKSLDDCLRMLLADPASLRHPGWRPQSDFVPDPAQLDFVGRYESLAGGWQTVCDALGVQIPLPAVNAAAREPDGAVAYRTPFACEAAARIYRRDLALFGYPLPVPVAGIATPRTAEPAAGARRLARGVVGIAKAVAGVGRATPEVVAARRATCDACPHWKQLPGGVGHRCDKCGCSGLKLWLASEGCPIGKWGPADT